jgi:hypothetical protein
VYLATHAFGHACGHAFGEAIFGRKQKNPVVTPLVERVLAFRLFERGYTLLNLLSSTSVTPSCPAESQTYLVAKVEKSSQGFLKYCAFSGKKYVKNDLKCPCQPDL